MVGIALRNSFDKPVGGVALRYSRSAFAAKAQAQFEAVATVSLLAMLTCGALMLAATLALFRRFRRQYLAFQAAADGGQANLPLPVELAEALASLGQAEQKLAALEAATREVQAIDDAA